MQAPCKRIAGRDAVRPMALLAAALFLSGCAQNANWNASDTDLGGPNHKSKLPVTKAAMPSSVQPYPRIEKTLMCIRRTRVLEGKTFVVGPFADSTGKINAV